jgi:hypothetical protein
MESGGSGSCSTDLEASGSSVSEQYNEDDFDDYSDSLEEEGSGATSKLEVSAASGAGALCVGTRVQVLWREENEWFDGAIQRVEEGNEPRYYVLYDDGEQQWEVSVGINSLLLRRGKSDAFVARIAGAERSEYPPSSSCDYQHSSVL